METALYEPFAQPVQQYEASYFRSLPLDARWQRTRYHPYRPLNPARESKHVTFQMPPWTSNSIYNIHDALLAVKMKIVDKDGKTLPNNTVCGPINNVYASIFSDLKASLNRQFHL